MRLLRFLSMCSFALLCASPFARCDVRADYYNATLVSGTWSCAGKSMTTGCDASSKGDSPLCIDRGPVTYCCAPNAPFCKSASVQCNFSDGETVLCGGKCCQESKEVCAGSNTFSNDAADQCASLTTFNPLNNGKANSYFLALTQFPHPGVPAADVGSSPTSASASKGPTHVSAGDLSNTPPAVAATGSATGRGSNGSSLPRQTSSIHAGVSNSRASTRSNALPSASTWVPSWTSSGLVTSATKVGSKSTASGTATATSSKPEASTGRPNAPNMPGNEKPYDVGTRVGFYMIGAASLIGFFHAPCLDSAVQVLAAVVSFAYITTWTQSVAHHALSPSEASVVLAMISSCLLPTMLLAVVWAGLPWTRHQFARILGPISYRENVEERTAQQEYLRSLSSRQAIVLLLLGVSSFWLAISSFWLWGSKVYHLPTNGQNDIGWFFAKIGGSDTGKFRALMLFLCVLLLLICLASTVCFLRLWKAAAASWVSSVKKKGEVKTTQDPNEVRNQHSILSIWPAILIAVIVWAFCIAYAESTIRVNRLSPNTTVDSAAQLLLLIAGVVALSSAILLLFRSLASDLPSSSLAGRNSKRQIEYLKEKLKEFMRDPISCLPGISSRDASVEQAATTSMVTEPHLTPWDPTSTFARGSQGKTKYERIRTPPRSPLRGYIHSDNSREPSPLPTLEENP